MNHTISLAAEVKKIFVTHFGKPDLIVRSPGRINLIGEHTDYNMGFVLPASIDKAIYVAISKRADDEIHLVAGDLSETYQTKINALAPTQQQWPDFILGVADQLLKKGYSIQGFNLAVIGDVPLGAGLSSSAAVECAVAFALNELYALGLSKKEMVQLAQKAENEFVGVQCGIMDQFASMFGQEGQVIQLDCRSLEYAYMPFDTKDIHIVLFDTGVKHSLASTEYNLRRQECEAGLHIIQRAYPQIRSLRDATIAMVNECLTGGDPVVFNRCKYIVEEIQRLQDACQDLLQHDLVSFGKKMFETHAGLSKLYEVSCPEADALVEMVQDHPAVLGARMMGGGFGGCTINIVQKDKVNELIERVTPIYEQQFKRQLKTYVVSISNGTSTEIV
ncbi:MAG: galactokinase [Bacteroidota bacterium]